MPRGKKKKKGSTSRALVPVKPVNKIPVVKVVVADNEKLMEEKASKEAIAQMNDKLREATDKVFSMIVSIAKEGIKRMWKLGEFVRKIRDNEDTYGENAIYLLEKAIGKTNRGIVQKAVHLNVWLTEIQLDKMLSLKMKITGKPLSWQHYEKLLTIKDKDRREEVLKDVVEKELTPEETQKLALHARGELQPHSGGRPVAIPATYTAKAVHYLKRMKAITRDADAIYDNDAHGFYEMAESMPADKISPEMIEKTQEMVETTREVLDFSRQFVLRLEQVVAILQKRMNMQAQQQGEAEADAISSKPKKSAVKKAAGAVKPDDVPF